ncbi:MAG: ectoine/hydroxyectoine ABC transporter substrate-binding protein EhuB [Dongiaceae bacterium]
MIAALAALGAGAFILTMAERAVADDTLDQAKQQGFIRIAIGNEPPFTAIKPDGSVSGASPDMARMIFKQMGIPDVSASVSEMGAMIAGLQAHRFDAVTAGLFIKPERCAAVLFSEPMLCDTVAFIVKKGNPFNLHNFKDIANNPKVRMSTVGGSVQERLAIEAGVPRDRIVLQPDPEAGVKMLQDDRADVDAMTVLSIADLMKKANDPNVEMVAPVGAPIYCDGVAFRKQDTALRDAFDKVLAQMKASGEFAKVIEPYGFSAATAMATSREKLCGGPN